jgi:DNA-binding transcriptional LysR family regulator
VKIKIRELRYFVAVAEELSFKLAAERLGKEPGNGEVSTVIRALEAALGAPLFIRTTNKVQLTEFGANLLPHVQKILAELAALPQLVKALRDGKEPARWPVARDKAAGAPAS